MGNYCSVCGRKIDSGNYCLSCYKRKYPSCGHCKKALLPNQEIVGSYHKFPCYSQKSRRCCQCDAPVDYSLNGTYCRNCYDSKHPPPPRVSGKCNGNEFTLHMRADEFNSKMESLTYALSRALSDGRE